MYIRHKSNKVVAKSLGIEVIPFSFSHDISELVVLLIHLGDIRYQGFRRPQISSKLFYVMLFCNQL